MPTVDVALTDHRYAVRVEHGLLGQVGAILAEHGLAGKKVSVISDSNVAALHAPVVMDSLTAVKQAASLHVVPAGEGSKAMTVVENVCREMILAGHDRSSSVIALGGGVVGDLAGFIASIFYRGLPLVQIPTTIVSQVDSSVGGKTGVNTPEGKNLIGSFHQPRMVLVDPETLKTLPPRAFREGFAEAIKHAAIRDAEMLEMISQLDPNELAVPVDLLARNLAIKARIVEADEFETGNIRALLNFGHTIGHGIEASVAYGKLLHGEAVALGMRAALWLSEQHAGLSRPESQRVLDAMHHFGLPLLLDSEITTETIMEKLSRDKKFSAGAIRFVVLEKLGHAVVIDHLTAADLCAAIEHIRLPL
ncbi:MAG: 3-dehydroquinate synthase [Verrucomicrobia bacterium]|nr:MAG: 3-dehydroquinate synthase [Verrucomicrobiota bacterium]